MQKLWRASWIWDLVLSKLVGLAHWVTTAASCLVMKLHSFFIAAPCHNEAT